jgi:hypothetical protein
MINKKIQMIIVGVLAIALVIALIFSFGFKKKDKIAEDEKNQIVKIIENKNENKKSDNVSSKEDVLNNLNELKNNHPEFSDSQLEFYKETAEAEKDFIKPCIGRSDENDCIVSVAFIKKESEICGEIGNQEAKIECANAILQKTTVEKIGECKKLYGNAFANCLGSVFTMYDRQEDCLVLISLGARQACEDIFNYKAAFIRYNRESCKRIIDKKLSQYCLKNIIDGFLDSDNDGLTDLDEIKYKTDLNNSDTDGDGYSDGEEVKKGYNPLQKD